MKNIVKKYTNGEVTIDWQPGKCCHSGICVEKNPEVFRPEERPWIKPENSTTQEIIKTLELCPTEALTYYMNSEKE